MYIYTYTHIYIYMSLHVAHVGGKMCGQIGCRRVYEIPRNVYIDIYISIYGSTCVYMYVYICIYTYTYIYIHTYIYTCIHSPDMWPNVQANAYLIPLEIYIYIYPYSPYRMRRRLALQGAGKMKEASHGSGILPGGELVK